FAKMRKYLEETDDEYSDNNRFGDGPNWKLRAIRKALGKVGLDPALERHGIPRHVFVCPLASNARQFLTQKEKKPRFNGLKSAAVVSRLALERWVLPRAERRPEFLSWRRDDLESLLVPSEKRSANVKGVAAKIGGT